MSHVSDEKLSEHQILSLVGSISTTLSHTDKTGYGKKTSKGFKPTTTINTDNTLNTDNNSLIKATLVKTPLTKLLTPPKDAAFSVFSFKHGVRNSSNTEGIAPYIILDYDTISPDEFNPFISDINKSLNRYRYSIFPSQNDNYDKGAKGGLKRRLKVVVYTGVGMLIDESLKTSLVSEVNGLTVVRASREQIMSLHDALSTAIAKKITPAYAEVDTTSKDFARFHAPANRRDSDYKVIKTSLIPDETPEDFRSIININTFMENVSKAAVTKTSGSSLVIPHNGSFGSPKVEPNVTIFGDNTPKPKAYIRDAVDIITSDGSTKRVTPLEAMCLGDIRLLEPLEVSAVRVGEALNQHIKKLGDYVTTLEDNDPKRAKTDIDIKELEKLQSLYASYRTYEKNKDKSKAKLSDEIKQKWKKWLEIAKEGINQHGCTIKGQDSLNTDDPTKILNKSNEGNSYIRESKGALTASVTGQHDSNKHIVLVLKVDIEVVYGITSDYQKVLEVDDVIYYKKTVDGALSPKVFRESNIPLDLVPKVLQEKKSEGLSNLLKAAEELYYVQSDNSYLLEGDTVPIQEKDIIDIIENKFGYITMFHDDKSDKLVSLSQAPYLKTNIRKFLQEHTQKRVKRVKWIYRYGVEEKTATVTGDDVYLVTIPYKSIKEPEDVDREAKDYIKRKIPGLESLITMAVVKGWGYNTEYTKVNLLTLLTKSNGGKSKLLIEPLVKLGLAGMAPTSEFRSLFVDKGPGDTSPTTMIGFPITVLNEANGSAIEDESLLDALKESGETGLSGRTLHERSLVVEFNQIILASAVELEALKNPHSEHMNRLASLEFNSRDRDLDVDLRLNNISLERAQQAVMRLAYEYWDKAMRLCASEEPSDRERVLHCQYPDNARLLLLRKSKIKSIKATVELLAIALMNARPILEVGLKPKAKKTVRNLKYKNYETDYCMPYDEEELKTLFDPNIMLTARFSVAFVNNRFVTTLYGSGGSIPPKSRDALFEFLDKWANNVRSFPLLYKEAQRNCRCEIILDYDTYVENDIEKLKISFPDIEEFYSYMIDNMQEVTAEIWTKAVLYCIEVMENGVERDIEVDDTRKGAFDDF